MHLTLALEQENGLIKKHKLRPFINIRTDYLLVYIPVYLYKQFCVC